MKVWDVNKHAYNYYDKIEKHALTGQIQNPDAFCALYVESHISNNLQYKQISASGRTEYKSSHVQKCKDQIHSLISPKLTTKEIMHIVYRDYTENPSLYVANPETLFHYMIPYVKHVAEKMEIEGEVLDPVTYCFNIETTFLSTVLLDSSSSQPTNGNEDKICLEQIQFVFKNCSNGEKCIKFAFTDLKNDLNVWKENKYAYKYYEFMESNIQKDQENLMPEDFCYWFKKTELSEEIEKWQHFEATTDLNLPEWMAPKVKTKSEITKEYLAPKIEYCKNALEKHISAITDQYIIAKIIYREFTVQYESVVKSGSQQPTKFSPLIDNFIHINMVTSYVKYVAENFRIEGQVLDPNDYCSKYEASSTQEK